MFPVIFSLNISFSNVQIFSFRLKDILDKLLTITLNDFEDVLGDLKLLGGKGKSIIYQCSFYLLCQLQ